MTNAPVVFIIFNRPDNTRQVFEQIRKAKPKQLFIVADGARINVAGEEELVAETRRIVEKIDWQCDVRRNYADTNMGCKDRVISGLNWVFEQVQYAIILEDDCLPSISFFSFCAELLERYKDDERITSIAGNTVIDDMYKMKESYGFSYFHNIWGWATWKRAWKLNDPELVNWPGAKKEHLLREMFDFKTTLQWEEAYNAVLKGLTNCWGYQWEFAQQYVRGLTIVPNVNMIKNIGFASGAHYSGELEADSLQMRAQAKDIQFPLTHPDDVKQDKVYDKMYVKYNRAEPIYIHFKRFLKHILGRI